MDSEVEYKDISVSIDKEVAIICLNRPEKGNSISLRMAVDIKKAFQKLGTDVTVRVIIFTGSGKYFCTGADLSFTGSVSATTSFVDILEAIINCPKPIICKVNGPVMGGGCGLVFVSDIRIFTSSAFMSFPEVKRGLIPAMISAYIVPQLGIYKSKQYMLTGQRISPEELLNDGVITSVVQNEQQMEKETDKYVNELLSGAPDAISKIKNLVQYIHNHDHQQNLPYVHNAFNSIKNSDEAIYGINCFLKKIKPEWTKYYQSKSKM
jgi:methylglutaconyl-CoA hydratase